MAPSLRPLARLRPPGMLLRALLLLLLLGSGPGGRAFFCVSFAPVGFEQARVGWGEETAKGGCWGDGEVLRGEVTTGPCPLPAASRELLLEARAALGLCGGAGRAVGASPGTRPSSLRSPSRRLQGRGARCPLFPLSPRAIVRTPAASSPPPPAPAPAPRRPPARPPGPPRRTWLYLYCFLSGSLATQGAPRFLAASPFCSGGSPQVLGQGKE